MTHILHAYELGVRKKGDRASSPMLGNFDGHGTVFIDVFQAFLEDPARRDWSDDDTGTSLRIGEIFKPTGAEPDVIAAWLKTGEKGFSSEFVDYRDKQLGDDVLYKRKKTDVELIPVLMLAKLPAMRSRGFLICHSPHNRGVKTRFWEGFKGWFHEKYEDCVLEISPCVPEAFYRTLIREQQLKKVTYIRQVRPSDIADDSAKWFDDRVLGWDRTVITPKGRGTRLRKRPLEKVLESDNDLQSLLVFRGETYDEVRTTFTDGRGREYSINFGPGGGRTPRAGYDVTEQLVDDDSTGHPTYQSLHDAAIGYIEVLMLGSG